jgi:hypothetical protein
MAAIFSVVGGIAAVDEDSKIDHKHGYASKYMPMGLSKRAKAM